LLGPIGEVELTSIAWAIVGGESGPRARPMEPTWATELRMACERFGVAFFFKQWGGARPKSGGRLLDGEEWNGFPTHIVPERILAQLT
jgi:protein gp37